MLNRKWSAVLVVAAMSLGWNAGCDKQNTATDNAPQAQAPEADNAEATAEENAAAEPGAAQKAEALDEMAAEDKAKADDGASAETAEIGQAAPEFTLTDEAGEEHSLSDYKGKIVVLEWTNPTCPFVERHYKTKTMAQAHDAVGGEDKVVWLAVDSSKTVDPAEEKKWKEEQGFSYPVLIDKEGAVGKLYGAKTTPHMFVVDTEGVLQYSGAIDDDERGTKEEPKNYVIEAVTAIAKGEPVPTSTTKPYGCSVKYGS